jgi:glucosamine--fructose-6-phosphate aminotransferase (isomerizing)
MPAQSPGHLMLSEIREQPTAIRRLIDAEFDRVWALAERWQANKPRAIFLAARGTSDHAALYAKYLFETMTGIPVGLASPSIASVYHAHVNVAGTLLIGISQSGEAADVISVLEQADRDGADTLAITNVANSPITAAAHHALLLHANPELSVAATKTFTSTLASLVLLAAAIGRNTALRDDLLRIPALLEKVLALEEPIRARVERFRYLEECVVLGRGYNLGTAYELALKLRETCYIRAQPFASPDFVHGPIAIIEAGYPVIAFANRGPSLDSVMEVIEQTQARGAEAVVIGNAEEALAIANVAFPVNVDEDVPEAISPFQAIMAGQFMAQAVSVLKGIDPDTPRGLRKVTITH